VNSKSLIALAMGLLVRHAGSARGFPRCSGIKPLI